MQDQSVNRDSDRNNEEASPSPDWFTRALFLLIALGLVGILSIVSDLLRAFGNSEILPNPKKPPQAVIDAPDDLPGANKQ